ncbi:MAG: leucine-rich repeat domain-containing protein [Bacteroidales bacterium]|jgi:Leucine-rich repeat (LRR) protein|nr:leucine-rich repeat domain-containing protein [Bacteroidales bacterium]MDD3700096.1 leucine-rich repeat domain-containing protein [Bacteroidales bacterium]MDY0369080.1 leucine-rich repeat domain-containing protein [Bacteroidales bacterium]
MKRVQAIIFSIILLLVVPCFSLAQNHQQVITAEEMSVYREQAGQLAKFFEGTLNFLGDTASTVQEKEIIINESYAKIFLNEEVQIEDDLDDRRDVPINKDVRAYLKDVDFFFHSARFRFDLQSIESLTNDKGELYFKLTLTRVLDAKTLKGESVSSSRLRYMEVNIDPFKKDLRIASYYTTRLNEKEERRNWWAGLDDTWRTYFGQDIVLADTIRFSDIIQIVDEGIVINRRIAQNRRGSFFVMGTDTLPEDQRHLLAGREPDEVLDLDEIVYIHIPDTLSGLAAEADNRLRQFGQIKKIDISGLAYFTHLRPLDQLTQLEEVYASFTPIEDLSPLRNLSHLRILNISGSKVRSLSPLQYATNIKELYINQTDIADISTLQYFNQLEKLSANQTEIRSIEVLDGLQSLTVLLLSATQLSHPESLASLSNLRVLDLSETSIRQARFLKGLTALQQLHLDHTDIQNIEDLSSLTSLNQLHISNTKIDDLSPLQGLPELRRIYCDNSGVSAAMAAAFVRTRPDVLVIFDSQELLAWWENLPLYWRALFSEQTGIIPNPGTEELHQLINTPRLNLSGNKHLQEIQAISRMSNLKELSVSNTGIKDLRPLVGLNNLRKLDISYTHVNNLDALAGLFQLEELNIQHTQVDQLKPLQHSTNLKLILADNSQINTQTVLELKHEQPNVLIVYQTASLRQWWANLPDIWKTMLNGNIKDTPDLTPIELQQIADRKSCVIHNQTGISNLEPLLPLLFLEKLELTGTRVSDLNPISNLQHLKELILSGNPLHSIQALANLTQLEVLDIESTPISDLSPLAKLTNLKKLNISGTQIRNIKVLASLDQLEEVALYNSRIKSLQPLEKLPALRYLKCYNTKISKKKIDRFMQLNPDTHILYY